MTKNARTDPETGLRFYDWQGTDLVSVTSVRRLLGMAHPLHQWTLSKVVERAVSEYDTLGQMLAREATSARESTFRKKRIAEAKTWLRAAATEERDAAGERGTSVHEAIAAGLAPTDRSLPGEVVPFLTQWYDFLAQTKATVVASEKQVFSLRHGYAGTIDLILEWLHRLLLVDLKTSKGLYLDHAIQVVGYAMADFVGEDNVVDTDLTDKLHAVDGLALLHLRADGWELVEINATPDLFAAFTGSLAFARFVHSNGESIEGLVRHTTKSS